MDQFISSLAGGAVLLALGVQSKWVLSLVIGILAILYVVGRVLRKQPEGTVNPALIRRFNERVAIWWLMMAILASGLLLGNICCMILFFCVSFWALREFITMTPTRRGDQRALFWVFFFFTPLQYVLVANGEQCYEVFSILIPVYGSLFIPARIAMSGDPKRFLERSAKIQAGLLICVYALSFAPAILTLDLSRPPDTSAQANSTSARNAQGATVAAQEDRPKLDDHDTNVNLLLFFVILVQLGDILQYAWGRMLGRHVIAPSINSSRTWEGFIGGVVSITLLGIIFSWITPFGIWQAGLIAMITAIMGFAGGMTMSAIKRDRGVTDYGTLVQGHAGLLDRIDSICFAAPVFYHLARWYHSWPGI